MATESKGFILIVDDEKEVREGLGRILRPRYEVFCAADGEEALLCVGRQDIDLVMVDVKKPGFPGIEVFEKIKRAKEDVEFILIAGSRTPASADEALFLGAGAFVAKPFSASEVISRVGKALDRRSKHLRVKSLIRQIEALLPGEEERKEEKLLTLSRRLCQVLHTEEDGNLRFPRAPLSRGAGLRLSQKPS